MKTKCKKCGNDMKILNVVASAYNVIEELECENCNYSAFKIQK